MEEYVFYGTNDFNFKKLENPPKYPPILCGDCGKPLSMFTDDYQIVGGKYFHAVCPIPRTPVVTEKSVSEVLDPLLRYLYWPETLLTAALAEFDKMPRPIPGEEECKKAISEVMETLKATRSNIAKGILASYWCSPSVNRVVHELSKKHPAATFNPPK